MPHHYTTQHIENFQKRFKVAESGCHEWHAAHNIRGYGRFNIDGKLYGAHRVAWELANGPIPEGMFVCHHCDNPKCVNPEHLFLGTASDNMRDASRKGRVVRPPNMGELHDRARLTEVDVVEIRLAYSNGESQYSIARRYHVARTTIESVVSRKTWKHI